MPRGATVVLAIFFEEAETDEALKPATTRTRTKARTKVFFMSSSPFGNLLVINLRFRWTNQLGTT
jgi:hypothetical protein